MTPLLLVLVTVLLLAVSGSRSRRRSQARDASTDWIERSKLYAGLEAAVKAFTRHASAIILAAFLLGVGWLGYQLYPPIAEAQQFKEAHSPDKIIGKTEQEIVQMYGKADYERHDNDGALLWMDYSGWAVCEIGFKDGVASQVDFGPIH